MSKMNIYLLDNDAHRLDPSLQAALEEHGETYESLSLPADHEEILTLFADHPGGAVFLPGVWEDLFSVKVVGELAHLTTAFEPVIVGPAPSNGELAAAFNEGLSAYVEAPLQPGRLKQTMKRVAERYKRHEEIALLRHRIAHTGEGVPHRHLDPESVARDHYLGQAFLDIKSQKGPMAGGNALILLVSSSQQQQRQLRALLEGMGFTVKEVGTMADAVGRCSAEPFTVVISDGVLPDGDAEGLAATLHQKLHAQVPRFIVWSSSPEKALELVRPEKHIDDIILKPGPSIGLESVLPTIISAVYQSLPR